MKYLKWLGVVVVVLLLMGAAGYGYASYTSGNLLSKTYKTHRVDFPVPWPLTKEEAAKVQQADPKADLKAVALQRARKRGKHLVEARYVCVECHGGDFGGGTMVDDPAGIGSLHGPNLTTGKGGVTADFTVADWDRIVRHGVMPDGTPALMPSGDFQHMTDRELSDIIAYVRSRPPVDKTMPPNHLGPLGNVLLAVGKIKLSATEINDHFAAHPKLPPTAATSADFGKHLSQVCTSCHGSDYRGGPIAQGPPSWPPAYDLTRLNKWSFEQFEAVLRTGTRPDGSKVKAPMDNMVLYGAKMTDTEMHALFAYLSSLKPQPTKK